jgi:hypothetical protein
MGEASGKTQKEQLWADVFDSERAFVTARKRFLAGIPDRVEILRSALDDPSQRGTALRILPFLRLEERQELFDQLLLLSSIPHADMVGCHDAILSLPRDWVVSRIETEAEPIIATAGYAEYSSLLCLFGELDDALAKQLAGRAMRSEDSDVQEVGSRFLEEP